MIMKIPCKKTFHLNIKTRLLCRISFVRRFARSILIRVRSCCLAGKSSSIIRHHRHWQPENTAPVSSSSHANDAHGRDSSSDLVSLTISLYGDCNIGKTSFLMKYVGEDDEGDHHIEEMAMGGIKHVDKTLHVEGARICYDIWEVGGHVTSSFHDQIQAACNHSVAMLFMFDLTSRCTLNSVIQWYQEARNWNQNAIPVLIGTKFDDFILLPIDLQWTISSQARAYAKAMNATLFFSSARYNINVNKIFKFITAKLFNLHWNLERNLTIGEPIIDF